MKPLRLRQWPLTFLGLLCLLCSTSQGRANVILDWNAVIMAAIRLDNTGPTLSTRNLAILHVAMYDAVNSVTRTHQPYRFQVDAPSDTSAEAAAAAAGHAVLVELYPSVRARADETYDAWRALLPPDPGIDAGIRVGEAVAALVLRQREADGASTEVPYIPHSEPGAWRRTPPFFRPPLTPHWRYVTPFSIPAVEPFVPLPPPALDSPEYAASYNEVKALGGKTSTVRTAEQSQIAAFWADFSYTSMPPGHWHEIAASIATERGTSLEDTARLLALLGIAQADAAIVCWEAKFRYNLWRPVTAIQRGDEVGNPLTVGDPTWDQLLAAPPFPAYTSGHSTFSKASADVLTAFYGTDTISFTARSDTLPTVTRSFTSLSACADEVGLSRIYGGIHFPFDNVAGKACGHRIAQYVIQNELLPPEALPLVRIESATKASVRLRLRAQIGRACVIEESANLVDWTPAGSTTAAPGGSIVEIPAPGNTARFYRAREASPSGSP